MSTRTEQVSQGSIDTAMKVNTIASATGTQLQTDLLALCDTLDAAVAGSTASANAPLLAAALAVRTKAGTVGATFANVGLDLTNPRLS